MYWRWTGSKNKLLEQLFAIFRRPIKTYRAIMFGGGSDIERALELEVAERYAVNDINPAMMAAVRCLIDGTKRLALLELLREWAREEDANGMGVENVFYRTRSMFNVGKELSEVQIAACFIFLQACSYNGLWRVNKREGKYNTPYSRDRKTGIGKRLTFKQIDELEEKAATLWRAGDRLSITCGDFEAALALAREGDLCYVDPPYLGTFADYDEVGFDIPTHERLYQACLAAFFRGAQVWVSGSKCDETKRIYPGRQLEVFTSYSNNSDGANRGKKTELLIEIGRT